MYRPLRKVHAFYVLVDLLVMEACFYISYFLYFFKHGFSKESLVISNFESYSFIFILWTIFTVINFKKRNLYFTDRNLSIPKEIFNVFTGVLFTSILIAGVIFFIQYKFFSRQIFFISFLLLCIFLSGWRTAKRLILRKLISEGLHNINVMIVGAGKTGQVILEEIKRNPYWGFSVIGFLDDSESGAIDNIPILGKLSSFSEVARKHFIDEVVVTIASEKKSVTALIKEAKKIHLGLRIVPEDFEESLLVSDIAYLGITPLLTYKVRKPHPAEFALKRAFDFLVSLILLILLSPLFLLIAILIKLDSRGPVFYVQKRTGYKGMVFNFYKFRSMVKEADEIKSTLADRNESKGNIIFKIKDDPRVTRIGRFLRRHSLDEFSQLINVLKGDMSLVGPRPFPVDETAKFESNHLERYTVRPGITGLAQIRGRSDLSIYRWVKWDLWYINNWSFWLDLTILWKTIPELFKAKGAY